MQTKPCPGLIIAAPRSGTGKTTVSLGLMRALSAQGTNVQPFKCGPDYIDPAFHAHACRRPSYNLDTWAMRAGLIATLIAENTKNADIAIVEGVMGLFDGAAECGQFNRGSTAELAAFTGWPIVLVIDIAGQAETAAAIALGCKTYCEDIKVAAVILNNVAGDRHKNLVQAGFKKIKCPVLGYIERKPDLSLPERHLGLVQAGEHTDLEERLDALANLVTECVDIDGIKSVARSGETIEMIEQDLPQPPGQRIALAQDAAFSFAYPHVISRWRSCGAEIVPFSVLDDEAPEANCDAVWLPGGYPELHAGRVAKASKVRRRLHDLANNNIPIHGECGGYISLGQGLIDAHGDRHEMFGLLSLESSFVERKLHLGYRRSTLRANTALGRPGSIIFGHEFHYATAKSNTDSPFAEVENASGQPTGDCGAIRGSVSGTFVHAIDMVEAQ